MVIRSYSEVVLANLLFFLGNLVRGKIGLWRKSYPPFPFGSYKFWLSLERRTVEYTNYM